MIVFAMDPGVSTGVATYRGPGPKQFLTMSPEERGSYVRTHTVAGCAPSWGSNEDWAWQYGQHRGQDGGAGAAGGAAAQTGRRWQGLRELLWLWEQACSWDDGLGLPAGQLVNWKRGSEPPPALVIEDFQLQVFRRDKVLLTPVQVAWAFLGLADGPVVSAWQSPGLAKTTATDKRLKALGLWVPGRPHECDALRHLVLYMRQASSRERA